MLHEEFAPVSRPRTESLLPCAPGTLGQLVTHPRTPLAYSVPVASVEKEKERCLSLPLFSGFFLPSSILAPPFAQRVNHACSRSSSPLGINLRRSRSPRALRDHPSFCAFPRSPPPPHPSPLTTPPPVCFFLSLNPLFPLSSFASLRRTSNDSIPFYLCPVTVNARGRGQFVSFRFIFTHPLSTPPLLR